jgi:hypothetical protein
MSSDVKYLPLFVYLESYYYANKIYQYFILNTFLVRNFALLVVQLFLEEIAQ